MRHIYRELQIIITVFCIVMTFGVRYGNCQSPDTLQAHFNVQQCDSLILANSSNPDFVILDVRTVSEYTPQHLVGAINRDFYSSNFFQNINSLPRGKMYVIYCLGGGRSLQAYNMMMSFGFPLVVNMLGGISAWNSASLPTTPVFAPLLMSVSDSLVRFDTIAIGQVDTLKCTITNRANGTLRFSGLSDLSGTEFSTNFDTTQYLPGASDYTFSIFYMPVDTIWDSLAFVIQSNGGMIDFHVTGTGISTAGIYENNVAAYLNVYPNPTSGIVNIDFKTNVTCGILSIRGLEGQIIESLSLDNVCLSSIEIPGPPGVYVMEVVTAEGDIFSAKILKY